MQKLKIKDILEANRKYIEFYHFKEETDRKILSMHGSLNTFCVKIEDMFFNLFPLDYTIETLVDFSNFAVKLLIVFSDADGRKQRNLYEIPFEDLPDILNHSKLTESMISKYTIENIDRNNNRYDELKKEFEKYFV